ncbi:MAG: hypothetical protein R2764_20565 [Bacteroidales bacterium]
MHLKIESKNSFPHSGIASSASSMSALALCLVSIEKELFGTLLDEKSFLKKHLSCEAGVGECCPVSLWSLFCGESIRPFQVR